MRDGGIARNSMTKGTRDGDLYYLNGVDSRHCVACDKSRNSNGS